MEKHVNHITTYFYKILKDNGRIRKYLEQSHLEKMVPVA